jgi:S1-C subfamily serine protease
LPPPDPELSRDIDAYVACVNKAIVTLAIATPDRADDVIVAARGLCLRERSATVTRTNALGRNGEDEAKSGDATIHDSLVAQVLLARAHPAPGQDQSTAGSSQPQPEEPKAVPKPEHGVSSGTGFFVTTDGAVVTNAHVVDNCSAIHVTNDQGAMVVAKIFARDIRNDLALLGTSLAVKKTATFRTSIRLGEAVEAFGFPLTQLLAKSGNITSGNVSALVGIGEDSRYLQISAPVQPGNSGGPLLDQSGNLVGVVSAKLDALRLMFATNGDIPQNINFAIKAPIVTNFMDANGVAYGTGVATQPMQPADLADQAKAMSVFIECQ